MQKIHCDQCDAITKGPDVWSFRLPPGYADPQEYHFCDSGCLIEFVTGRYWSGARTTTPLTYAEKAARARDGKSPQCY
jgi:hypothetical protein